MFVLRIPPMYAIEWEYSAALGILQGSLASGARVAGCLQSEFVSDRQGTSSLVQTIIQHPLTQTHMNTHYDECLSVKCCPLCMSIQFSLLFQ